MLNDIQLPAIRKAASFICVLGCYHELALPEAFEKERTVRLRRMMGAPVSRLVGFLKVAPDQRRWNWHADF